MGQVIEVTGTVVGEEFPDLDADDNFNVQLDPGQGQEVYVTAFGGRLTSETPSLGPSIHCEITAWASSELRATFDRLRVGDRVRVRGAWGFDGVHVGGYPEWIQVLLALWRHQPDLRGGWWEIHPVTACEILVQEPTPDTSVGMGTEDQVTR